ncbi:MAG TPA: single-stranded-DNA-specific exonuclease RecJ [Trichocoleus sp.]|jgi:single-stranded-DNA-specific exonuclease
MPEQPQWQIQPIVELSAGFVQTVEQAAGIPASYAAQLLWQRGMRDTAQLPGFLNPNCYQPTSPFAFGQEMEQAVDRLLKARENQEKVAIWGDFDADGITATAVLWEGLGQFFPAEQLTYFIPNRLTESHGLSIAGMDLLMAQGYHLIVTCDTGSTNFTELAYAQQQDIEVIITDHHTLPESRPPVAAILNPRTLPASHPLASLSGVAVAYKLVEALYETLPDVASRPLNGLLDLVAIGLIADLVSLTGDCRYLAQRGIEQLQQHRNPTTASRPGIAKLLELCQRNGDRPTDISFGLGPRINAISRIHGDARFCVELLTSQDIDRCTQLAQDTELANTRRKALQKDMVQQVRSQLSQLDLSTTSIIVLADPQWSVGVLGLVAGQIAQEYGRPTILLTTDRENLETQAGETIPEQKNLARGSARSYGTIDLYQLFQSQSHLLHRFGGHPLAAGLSLPIENLPLFTEALNRCLRQQESILARPLIQADLTVTVAALGKDLFRELKLLEPYGMGNPTPKLLIQNCWFRNVRNQNIQDWRGRKVKYIKTEFEIWDETVEQGFPGIWWDHYKDEIPVGPCDAVVELDFNAYKKRYEIRLIALRPTAQDSLISSLPDLQWLVDWRKTDPTQTAVPNPEVLQITACPSNWDELQFWFRRARRTQQPLILAYQAPPLEPPIEIWQTLVGIAKYLSRTQKKATRLQFIERLGVGDRPLQAGFLALKQLGFTVTSSEQGFQVQWHEPDPIGTDNDPNQSIQQFLWVVQEEQFQRNYFYEVPLPIIKAVALQTFQPYESKNSSR